uniref:Putative pheromone receptor protein isoform s1 n=1 Tax=Flammulina filiformis TaxID=2060913 RepID=A0A6C0MZQ8_9AGAR|nr:putative pheromone receptor protein isoform s1 [Flammulina filiformis]
MAVGTEITWVPNELFIVFSFVAFILCALPFPFYLRAWNVGTSCYAFWTGLACLNSFINAIIWNHNAINWAPVWCDISTRIILSENVSLTICSFVINRRLYWMATSTSVNFDRRKAIRSDLLLCLGVPILQMIVAIIPTGNRFSIFEDIGCANHIPNTWVSILLIQSWPLAIGLASAYYCIRCLIVINKRRQHIREVFSGDNAPNQNMYFRLMIMSATEVICTIPLASFIMWSNTRFYRPWVSWDDVHADFLRIDQYPAILWRSPPENLNAAVFEVSRWFKIFGAFLFFGLYGSAGEFRKKYKAAFLQVIGWFGLSKICGSQKPQNNGNAPSLVFASRWANNDYLKTTLGNESGFATGDVDETSVASPNNDTTIKPEELEGGSSVRRLSVERKSSDIVGDSRRISEV